MLHKIKERCFPWIDNLFLKRFCKNRTSRNFWQVSLLFVVVSCILFGLCLLSQGLGDPLLSQSVFNLSASLLFLFWATFAILCLGSWSLTQKIVARNVILIIIFLIGSVAYTQLNSATEKKGKERKIFIIRATEKRRKERIFLDAEKKENIRKFLNASNIGNTVVAAFFPSRGTYEINGKGELETDNAVVQELPLDVLFWYLFFHICVYIFFGYFALSLWGGRVLNRLRWFLTLDRDKNVFWCRTLEPKILELAKSIRDKTVTEQSLVSVSEFSTSDHGAMFSEMNFQKICLKLRKPRQVHSDCLNAARHFFITENPDWNVNKAQHLIAKFQNNPPTRPVKIYIRVNNDARKLYFNRWADAVANRQAANWDIIFIDECALVAEKLIYDHPMLETVEIDPETATVSGEFKVLIIGFGGLGRACLEQTIRDCQCIGKDGKPVNFSADIVDNNQSLCELYKSVKTELCERFNLNFCNMVVPSAEFCDKFNNCDVIDSYNRIIIALGNAQLNIETAAVLERICRQTVAIGDGCKPKDVLMRMKKKIFLVSPEINSQALQAIPETESLFTIYADGCKMYDYNVFVNDKIDQDAQRIDWYYKESKQKQEKIWSKDAGWYVNKDGSRSSMYDRDSSRATAMGLRNNLLLTGASIANYRAKIDKEHNKAIRDALVTTEHLRWWAFMLTKGYRCWENPSKNIGGGANEVKDANQIKNYLRHATMVEGEMLSELSLFFRNDANYFRNNDVGNVENLMCFLLTPSQQTQDSPESENK